MVLDEEIYNIIYFLFFNILPREIEEMKNSEDSSKLLPKMKIKTEVAKLYIPLIYTDEFPGFSKFLEYFKNDETMI